MKATRPKAAPEADEPFAGFADARLSFFRALEKHQDRAWFAEHKDEYESGWADPMRRLLSDARAKLDAAYAHCELSEPKVFRIHRDVRFSKDKSPYKTMVSGVLSASRKSAGPNAPAALYTHLGIHEGKPEHVACVGHYMMMPDELARYRKALLDEERGGELSKILGKLTKKGFVVGSGDSLKGVPKGMDPEHPRADLLKRKGLILSFPPFELGSITSRAFLDGLLPHAKQAAPVVEWLVFATA
jgi:uncharacterized protein (TIGR02453 family)